VGHYKGKWLGQPIRVEVVYEDGKIALIRTPRYSDTGGNTDSARYRMVALSETAFDCSCGLGFVFKLDAAGAVIGVAEVHVSGEWIFDRID
jgi:hypothetical protein